MNPYEQPLAELRSPQAKQPPAEPIESVGINWWGILTSGLICFVVSIIQHPAVTAWFPGIKDIVPQAILNTFFFFPWVLGAFYLGCSIRFRRISHGFIYSVIPPLITLLIFAAINRRFDRGMLPFAAILMAISLAVTLVTMALTKVLLRLIEHGSINLSRSSRSANEAFGFALMLEQDVKSSSALGQHRRIATNS